MTERGIGWRNRLFGWCLFLAGILGGMALGTWVFDGPLSGPERLAEYGSLPRRLIRLAHISAVALGPVNVLYGHEIDTLLLSKRMKRLGSASMILAGALMPAILSLASFRIGWKWGLPVPAVAAFVAASVLVYGLTRKEKP